MASAGEPPLLAAGTAWTFVVGALTGVAVASVVYLYLALFGAPRVMGGGQQPGAGKGAGKGEALVTQATMTTTTRLAMEPGKTMRDAAPRHVAVIMDGNRRFGRKHHSDPLKGHWAGGQTLVDFAQWCMEEGVSMLTVFAFSTENWNRDAAEIAMLMKIFAKYAETVKVEALKRNTRVKVISTNPEKLPRHVQQAITDLQQATANCTAFQINICLSYGARAEVAQACQGVARRVAAGELLTEDITEQTVKDHLLTADLPDPELLIRTSGESRISNFLLYQLAYSELFFIDKFWPEVSREDLHQVLLAYSQRHRRFGS